MFAMLFLMLTTLAWGGDRQAPPYDPADTPAELEDWVDWVRARHPALDCARVEGRATCNWPGDASLKASDTGASLTMKVRLDVGGVIALPGGPATWPHDVTVDGTKAPVEDHGGVPKIRLRAGSATIAATYEWPSLPADIPWPTSIARTRLTVGDTTITRPQMSGGRLSLGQGGGTGKAGEALTLAVARRIRDAIPVNIETRITLRVSGPAREIELHNAMLPKTRTVRVDSSLSTQLAVDGRLLVQVRPGTWDIHIGSLYEGSMASLAPTEPIAPWPDAEVWAVKTNDSIRSVQLSGPPGVDPSTTHMPGEWSHLPAFWVDHTTPLLIETLRRGVPTPQANQIRLDRNLWLDADGAGMTVQDRFTGALHRDWRLDAMPSVKPGRIQADGRDIVITTGTNGRAGTELRATDLDVTVDGRIERPDGEIRAIGWYADVDSLATTFHLPPGWRLLAISGADTIQGTWVDKWSLLDVFGVMLLVLAAHRILGGYWGPVTLVTLLMSWHDTPDLPALWILGTTGAGLARLTSADHWLLLSARRVFGMLLLVIGAQHAVFSLRSAAFVDATTPTGCLYATPESRQAPTAGGRSNMNIEVSDDMPNLQIEENVAFEQASRSVQKAYGSGAQVQKTAGPKKKSWDTYDPKAVVQTGPGLPEWTHTTASARWSGPVDQGASLRFYLMGPVTTRIVDLAQAGLVAWLAWTLFSAAWRRATPVLLLLLTLTVPTRSALADPPTPELLAELESRIVQPPRCEPNCLSVPEASLTVQGSTLKITTVVHAGTSTAWAIPGPTDAWVPSLVTVDGEPTQAMRRNDQGMIEVRLRRGVHTVAVSGPLPSGDSLALTFTTPPRSLDWSAEGWRVDGVRQDGSVAEVIQVSRVDRPLRELSGTRGTLATWLAVERTLEIGTPWRVHTTVRRVDSGTTPVQVRVPLLEGESLTEGGHEVQEGNVQLSLPARARASWSSTLEETDQIALTAPLGVPWSETWNLNCTRLFSCEISSGPAPVRHEADAAWQPRWQVWPGELLRIKISKPEGIDGQTVTLDNARLAFDPGPRRIGGRLDVDIRSSRGGRHAFELPTNATLTSLAVDGKTRPLEHNAGEPVDISLKPGPQHVRLAWEQPWTFRLQNTLPTVDLGAPAANVHIDMPIPSSRWILWLSGPAWGSDALLVPWLLIVLGLGWCMSRLPGSPMGALSWALLGMGMLRFPTALIALVFGWLLAMTARAKAHPERPWLFDLVQIALAAWTLAAMTTLAAAVRAGLLWEPESLIATSSWDTLTWFADRTDNTTPVVRVYSLSLWAWRGVMLAWALWLASRVVGWAPWTWQAMSQGGWWKNPLPKREAKKA